MSRRIGHERNTAIADLLDRALNKGVVLRGEATISLAGIDLMYVGLKVLVSSFETAQRIRGASDMALPDGRRS
jgi:gas vesicle structural protein